MGTGITDKIKVGKGERERRCVVEGFGSAAVSYRGTWEYSEKRRHLAEILIFLSLHDSIKIAT